MIHRAHVIEREILHGHLFCGLGGGAKGFNRGSARVGNFRATFRCVGGVDSDPAAIEDFTRAAGVKGTVRDLFSREQYEAFHGQPPPPGWVEATPADLHQAFHSERPHIIFLSAPCKGFSGLLAESKSLTDKYQALNALTLRGVWLALEAYKDDPVELFVFENVPRIAKRGRKLLDRIIALFRAYGYVVAETTHDCGELGGLGQSRKRFLLVARHREKVPNFLYEPEKKSLRGVGEIIGRFPVPGPDLILPMHRMPALQWKTWVRLALVEAGSDWRSLNKLVVKDGYLADFGIEPEVDYRAGVMGVNRWEDSSGVVAGRSTATNGAFSVADVRIDDAHNSVLGVNQWDKEGATVRGAHRPQNGRCAVADPRPGESDRGAYGVLAMDDTGHTVTSARSPGQGTFSVADPRPGFGPSTHHNVMQVHRMEDPSKTVTSGTHPAGGALSVADPRMDNDRSGPMGVHRWEETGHAVAGESLPSNGAFAIADVRVDGHEKSIQLGVRSHKKPAPTVKGDMSVGGGPYAIDDPRILDRPVFNNVFRIVPFDGASPAVAGPGGAAGGVSVADPRFANWHPGASSTKMRVTPWQGPSGTATGSQQVGSGALAVQDPRPGERDDGYKQTKYRVTAGDEPSGAVIGASTTGNGAFAVADARPDGLKGKGAAYATAGNYGVVPWARSANAVPASANHDNGYNSVADPRDGAGNVVPFALPKPNDRLVCCIRALDTTWHRPFTTLELAALQSLVSDPEEYLTLEGLSDSAWRERIGNAVPPDAAEAMAGVFGQCLLGAWSGHTFMLSSQPIWVRNVVIGLSVKQLEELAA